MNNSHTITHALTELKHKKRELQDELQDALTTIVNRFVEETGVSVTDISVDMLDVTAHEHPLRQTIVGEVAVRLALGR